MALLHVGHHVVVAGAEVTDGAAVAVLLVAEAVLALVGDGLLIDLVLMLNALEMRSKHGGGFGKVTMLLYYYDNSKLDPV